MAAFDDIDDWNSSNPDDIDEANRLDKLKTELNKKKLINEIKNGLGAEILKNPSQFTIIKKPWYSKLFLAFKKIFTKL